MMKNILYTIVLLFLFSISQNAQNSIVTFEENLTSEQLGKLNNLSEFEKVSRTQAVFIPKSIFDSNRIQIQIFDGELVEFEKQDLGYMGVQLANWTGIGINGTQGTIAMVMHKGSISAHFTGEFGNYEIYPLGDNGEHMLAELDSKKFPSCGNSHSTNHFPDPVPVPQDENIEDIEKSSMMGPECFVRLTVGYTSLAQSQTLSVFSRSMIEHVALGIVESNQGYANGQAEVRVELSYLYEVTDNETANACNDVDDLQDSNDGKWDEIHTHRNNYDGDMVCLVTGGLYATNPNCNPNGGLCGIAFGFDYTDDANMFQLTEFDCLTGNFTFAHEFGHTQGCRHDNDNTGTPFSYARGRNNGTVRTIMAVSSSQTRLNFWSNPGVNFPGGGATGTSTRDNARGLDFSDFTVAHHRTTPSSFSTGITVDADEHLVMVTTTSLISTNTVENNAQSELKSEGFVRLNPGFHSKTGSESRVHIIGTCNASYSAQENEIIKD